MGWVCGYVCALYGFVCAGLWAVGLCVFSDARGEMVQWVCMLVQLLLRILGWLVELIWMVSGYGKMWYHHSTR